MRRSGLSSVFEVTALSLSVVCNSHVIKIVCEYVLMLINVQKTCLNGIASSLGIVNRPLKRDSGSFTDILAHAHVTVAIVASLQHQITRNCNDNNIPKLLNVIASRGCNSF